MLPLDDKRWTALEGVYRIPYDPRPALAQLRAGHAAAWDELWNELRHQGDVGTASYAAVPHLIDIHRTRDVPDWQTYALIGAIEACRPQKQNPALPDWMQESYHAALEQVPELGFRDLSRISDETTVRSIIGAIAIARGATRLGDIILQFSSDELEEMIDAFGGPRSI